MEERGGGGMHEPEPEHGRYASSVKVNCRR